MICKKNRFCKHFSRQAKTKRKYLSKSFCFVFICKKRFHENIPFFIVFDLISWINGDFTNLWRCEMSEAKSVHWSVHLSSSHSLCLKYVSMAKHCAWKQCTYKCKVLIGTAKQKLFTTPPPPPKKKKKTQLFVQFESNH